jgi:hypothetical protein
MKRKVYMQLFVLLILKITICFTANASQETKTEISGELKKWHKVTITFDGPETSEMDEFNPFMNYRFNVLFSHEATGKNYLVPGYFAADGNAGETSATSGNKWRVHFAPSETGKWDYTVDFRKGRWAAVSERINPGEEAGYMDGAEGSFHIADTDKTGRDNRARGRLQYDGTRYLKFAETGEVFLKVGPDAPENFLAYADFDGTFHDDGYRDNLVKTWEAHIQDWKEGDPTWKDRKGKGMIGAINYLASKGLNSFSFIPITIQGDDHNVFPFVDYYTYDRYDISKLDQWEVVFEHANKLGMFLHFKLMEQENQGLLDNGAIGAKTKLYYREMMARFGHHLALNWNIGEEFGDWARNHRTPPLCTVQRLAAAEYFHKHDPYQHHRVIHNPPAFDDLLVPDNKYTGVSVQVGHTDFSHVNRRALHWINASNEIGRQWAVSMDETGGAHDGLLPDSVDSEKNLARINGLWGAFLAGAWGKEWYFGYAYPHSDLTCEDWRTRDLFWDQCRHLLNFFKDNEIPVTETEGHNQLVQEGDYCLANPGDIYIVMLRNGSGSINLENQTGEYSIKWFDPRNGGALQTGTIQKLKAGKTHEIGVAPSEPHKDWVVLIRKI